MRRLCATLAAAGATALVLAPAASAHPPTSGPGSGKPDIAYKGGPLPENVKNGICPLIFDPVIAPNGTLYSNACFAAADGFRATWPG